MGARCRVHGYGGVGHADPVDPLLVLDNVLDWLRGLDKADGRAVGLDLMRVQFGWPIGMPLVGSLTNGLWEVRSTLPSQRIVRLIPCFHDRMLVVLHGFIKKTQKTPAADLALAKRRMKEVTK